MASTIKINGNPHSITRRDGLTLATAGLTAALRSNVASSKAHFGEAICQISLAKSCRYLS